MEEGPEGTTPGSLPAIRGRDRDSLSLGCSYLPEKSKQTPTQERKTVTVTIIMKLSTQ